ncbi:M50 family metallopeptidase [Lujinxingia vulgaris]|nr:M50 family metallopeptidase [Lujinxingia vulgaris]
MASSKFNPSARTLLLFAVALVVVTMLVPYGYIVAYPLRLFGTFVHETGHALATVITGGTVSGMHVNLDTSGLTLSRGGASLLISSAGYLGTVALGAALLVAGRRQAWARKVLMVLGVGTLLATAVFGGYGSSMLAVGGFVLGVGLWALGRRRSRTDQPAGALYAGGALATLAALAYLGFSGALLTWTIGLVAAALLLGVAFYAAPWVQHMLVIALGVQLSFDGLHSIRYLIDHTVAARGHSDAVNMAQFTGIPATVWAVLWALVGVAIVVVAFALFWRENKRESFEASIQ